jgi:hypothetical protein
MRPAEQRAANCFKQDILQDTLFYLARKEKEALFILACRMMLYCCLLRLGIPLGKRSIEKSYWFAQQQQQEQQQQHSGQSPNHV